MATYCSENENSAVITGPKARKLGVIDPLACSLNGVCARAPILQPASRLLGRRRGSAKLARAVLCEINAALE